MRSTTKKVFIFAAALGIVGCNYLIPDLKNVARDASDADGEVAGDDLETPDLAEWEADGEVVGDELEAPDLVEWESDMDVIPDHDVSVDENEEDLSEEPDGPEAGQTVFISDSGGGTSQNEQYTIQGGLSARSCPVSSNGDYVIESCAVQLIKP